MPKRTLWMVLLSVLLATVLAGCGGGGGKSTPPRTVSVDYYGMEVGAKYSYHSTYTDQINNALSNQSDLAAVVYSVDTNTTPGTAIYKVGDQTVGSANIEGAYIAKETTGNVSQYRTWGTWANNGTPDNLSEPSWLMTNPITNVLPAIQSVKVTVPAGTFDAYVLEDEITSTDGTSVQTTQYWFVPYIYGFVKKIEDYTLNGVAQSHTETVLTKVQFGVNTTIPAAAFQTKLSAKTVSAGSVLSPYRKK